jgi:hypothetical protein
VPKELNKQENAENTNQSKTEKSRKNQQFVFDGKKTGYSLLAVVAKNKLKRYTFFFFGNRRIVDMKFLLDRTKAIYILKK